MHSARCRIQSGCIDPIERVLEVFRLEGGFWTLQMAASGERGLRAEPFDAVELELGALWSAESGALHGAGGEPADASSAWRRPRHAPRLPRRAARPASTDSDGGCARSASAR
jgi:hypothetical protein